MRDAEMFEESVFAQIERDEGLLALQLWPEAYEFLAGVQRNETTCRLIDTIDITLAKLLFRLGAAVATVADALDIHQNIADTIKHGYLDEFGLNENPHLEPFEKHVEPVKCSECGAFIRVLPCRACRAREWKEQK